MTRQLAPLLLGRDEIDQLARCIVQHASADEAHQVERLLGQLATLKTVWSDEEHPLAWRPPPGTEDLATRAFEALRSKPKRRRFQRSAR